MKENQTREKNKQITDDDSIPKKPIWKRKKILYIGLAVIITIFIFTFLYLLYSKSPFTSPNVSSTPRQLMTGTKSPEPITSAYPTGEINPSFPDNKIIARVGEENIYRKHVEILILSETRAKGVDYEKIYTDKLIEESIILQLASKEKLIVLTSSVFNSESLDLNKRSALVKRIKDIIENRAEKIEGSVVSIWFYNVTLGSLGFEGGKKFALEKITPLQKQVKDGLITVKEAGERVKNDTSLAKIDKNYYYNAIFDFSSSRGEKISFDDSFNQVLWSLKEGETSDVYLLKDKIAGTGEMMDAVYMFGTVTKRIYNNNLKGFDTWFRENKGNYEVRYL